MTITLVMVGYQDGPPPDHIEITMGEDGGTIGRSRENDFVIYDPERYASRHHARVFFEDGDYRILDTSASGTLINDDIELEKGQSAELMDGDQLTIGYCTLSVAINEATLEQEVAPEIPEQRPTHVARGKVTDDILAEAFGDFGDDTSQVPDDLGHGAKDSRTDRGMEAFEPAGQSAPVQNRPVGGGIRPVGAGLRGSAAEPAQVPNNRKNPAETEAALPSAELPRRQPGQSSRPPPVARSEGPGLSRTGTGASQNVEAGPGFEPANTPVAAPLSQRQVPAKPPGEDRPGAARVLDRPGSGYRQPDAVVDRQAGDPGLGKKVAPGRGGLQGSTFTKPVATPDSGEAEDSSPVRTAGVSLRGADQGAGFDQDVAPSGRPLPDGPEIGRSQITPKYSSPARPPTSNDVLGAPPATPPRESGFRALQAEQPSAAFSATEADVSPSMPAETDDIYKEALEAFLAEFKMRPDHLKDRDLVEVFQMAGVIFKILTNGMMEVLSARSTMKKGFGMDTTRVQGTGNNALKFSSTAEEAIFRMLTAKKGFRDPLDAANEAVNDAKAHQVAMMSGMSAAVQAIVSRFDPGTLEQELDDGFTLNKKSRNWELYVERFHTIAEESERDFNQLFSEAFMESYQAQVRKLEMSQD